MASKKSEPSAAQKMSGDFAPKLVELTDDVLFGDIWERPGLSRRDRSLITVATLIVLNRTEQFPFHLSKALDNGVTRDELIEDPKHTRCAPGRAGTNSLAYVYIYIDHAYWETPARRNRSGPVTGTRRRAGHGSEDCVGLEDSVDDLRNPPSQGTHNRAKRWSRFPKRAPAGPKAVRVAHPAGWRGQGADAGDQRQDHC